MATPRVLCLGEILYDCLADRPDRAVHEVESWTLYPGGAPANVACGLVKLGIPAGFIGCVGQDKDGDALVETLRQAKVNIQGIQRDSETPTRRVYVTRSQEGERHFAGFGDIFTSEFADTRLSAADLPKSLFSKSEFLVLGTLALAYPDSLEAVHHALELAYNNDIQVLVDINWRSIFWVDEDMAPGLIWELVNQVDYVKCSQEEAQWLFETTDPVEIYEKLDRAEGVLVTAGKAGCDYCLGDWDGSVASFPVTAIDTTGAGDSFVAGFLRQACLLGEDLLEDEAAARQAVRYANAAGALATLKLGAIEAQPTPEEIEALLAQYPED
jgi:fructokinase